MKQQMNIELTLGADDMSWELTLNGVTFTQLTTEEAQLHVKSAVRMMMDEVIEEVTPLARGHF